MCEKCNQHLIEEHLRPLVGKHITTKRNLTLEVESIDAENGCLILRKIDSNSALGIICSELEAQGYRVAIDGNYVDPRWSYRCHDPGIE